MGQTPRQHRSGFSMIELVIVVVIIAIIGAIAIPRLSRGTEGAADSSLVGNLSVLRSAIDLYATEHRGNFPDLEDFEAQLTGYTNIDGDIIEDPSTADETVYGPYLRAVPPLPVGHAAGETGVAAALDTSDDTTVGWVYDENTGEIFANSDEADSGGRDYVDY